MVTLPVAKSLKGLRVILVAPDPSYKIGSTNPLEGTEYFCEGTVERVGDYIHVKWDNGTTNNYKKGELAFAERGSTGPGRMQSIW